MQYLNQVLDYTTKLVSFDTYAPENKLPLLEYVKGEIERETTATVQLHADSTGTPFLVAHLAVANPQFTFMLEGHMDVVSPEGMTVAPFVTKIQDGRIYGRGTCDMKGGVSGMLTAFMEAANEPGQTGDLYLVLTGDEEYSGNSILEAMEANLFPNCDFALIGEPTAGGICTAHKGNAWIDVDFFGKGAHASAPHLGINSIYMASDFICKFKEYTDVKYAKEESPIYGKPTMNIGMVNGGTQPNVVPAFTKVRIDKRYLPGDTMENFVAEVNHVLELCEMANPEFSAKFIEIVDCSSVVVERDNGILLEIKGAIDASCDRNVPFTMFSGWGEGGYMNRYGLPVIYYGPGDILEAHTKDESCDIQQIEQAAKDYYAVIKKLCF